MQKKEVFVCPECKMPFIIHGHWNKKLDRHISMAEMLNESFKRNPKLKLVCNYCGWRKWKSEIRKSN